MNSIGERIKYLRKEILQKTQKDFGTCIGLKPNSVSDIESGKNNPTLQTIKAICREFAINEDWIRNGHGEILIQAANLQDEYTLAVNQIDANDPRAKKLILEYWKLTPRDKELFMDFMERFVVK